MHQTSQDCFNSNGYESIKHSIKHARKYFSPLNTAKFANALNSIEIFRSLNANNPEGKRTNSQSFTSGTESQISFNALCEGTREDMSLN